MAITIRKPNARIETSAIDRLEASFEKKLPHDYRTFLLDFNGGQPENNVFQVPQCKNNAGVSLFYGLHDKRETGDLLYERQKMLDRVPKNVLIIGAASCGNLVCISLRDDTFGNVFFWDHEFEGEEGEPATFSNLFKIADSFGSFLRDLRAFDPSQVHFKEGQVKRAWINPTFLKSLKQKE